MTEPTDKEIVAFAVENGMHVRTGSGAVKFARAVLEKWGTPPVACAPLTDEQMYEECQTAGPQLLDLSKLWADNRIHVYQFVNEAEKIVTAVARRVEAAHGIKGGQHEPE